VDTILTGLVLFILALAATFLLIRWRTQVAAKKLCAQAVPESAARLPQHPDGVLLLFHHPRCGPCKRVVAQFEQIASTDPGRAQMINVAEQQQLTLDFAIRATPTTLFIKNNTINEAFVGATSLKTLRALLKLTD
jgi:thioredoxin-like negative regulator of GroEL